MFLMFTKIFARDSRKFYNIEEVFFYRGQGGDVTSDNRAFRIFLDLFIDYLKEGVKNEIQTIRPVLGFGNSAISVFGTQRMCTCC